MEVKLMRRKNERRSSCFFMANGYSKLFHNNYFKTEYYSYGGLNVLKKYCRGKNEWDRMILFFTRKNP